MYGEVPKGNKFVKFPPVIGKGTSCLRPNTYSFTFQYKIIQGQARQDNDKNLTEYEIT